MSHNKNKEHNQYIHKKGYNNDESETIDFRANFQSKTEQNKQNDFLSKKRFPSKILVKEVKINTSDLEEKQYINNKIDYLSHKIEYMANLLELQKKENDLIRNDFEKQKLLSNVLEKKVIKLENENDSLKKEIESLKINVGKLNKFYFEAQLRKLLKNLLGYIIKKFYPNYLTYNKITNKLY